MWLVEVCVSVVRTRRFLLWFLLWFQVWFGGGEGSGVDLGQELAAWFLPKIDHLSFSLEMNVAALLDLRNTAHTVCVRERARDRCMVSW